MADSSTRKLGVAMVVGGAVLGAVGVALAFAARKRGALQGGDDMTARKAKRVGQHKAGGMTLTSYHDARMPIGMRARIIQDLTRESAAHPQIRSLAQAIVGNATRNVQVGKYQFKVVGANCPAGDGKCKVDAIGRWTAANVRYTGDVGPVKMGRKGSVEAVDLFQTALRTIEIGGEDCDGHTTVNASLVEALGDPDLHARHRITKPRRNADWAHIYTVADVGGNLMALDTTLPDYRTGKEAQRAAHVDFPAY